MGNESQNLDRRLKGIPTARAAVFTKILDMHNAWDTDFSVGEGGVYMKWGGHDSKTHTQATVWLYPAADNDEGPKSIRYTYRIINGEGWPCQEATITVPGWDPIKSYDFEEAISRFSLASRLFDAALEKYVIDGRYRLMNVRTSSGPKGSVTGKVQFFDIDRNVSFEVVREGSSNDFRTYTYQVEGK